MHLVVFDESKDGPDYRHYHIGGVCIAETDLAEVERLMNGISEPAFGSVELARTTEVSAAAPTTPRGFPCRLRSLFRTCRRHYPGGTVGRACRPPSPTAAAFPESQAGVDLRIALFEGCSAFTARYGLCAR